MQSACRRVGAVVFTLVALGSAPCSAAEMVYDLPRVENVVVDGRMDDWDERGFRADLLLPLNGLPRAASDHDARARVGWDDKGLLLVVIVEDDAWVEDENTNMLWRGDSVELFLAPRRSASDWCQWIIAPGMAPQQPKVRCQPYDHRKDGRMAKRPMELAAARTKTGCGYILEVLAPWSCLAIQPEVGREVGLQFWVNDKDPKGATYHALWFPGVGTHADSRKMHRCRLANKPSPPESLRTRLAYDLDDLTMRLSLLARGEQIGRPVVLEQGSTTLARGTLADDGRGRARVSLALPMPYVGSAPGPIGIKVRGRDSGRLATQFPQADLSRSLMVKLACRGRTKWHVKLVPSRAKIERVVSFAGAWTRSKSSCEPADQGTALEISATTHWEPAVAVVELNGPVQGGLVVIANGHKQELDLGKLTAQAAEIKPGSTVGWAEHDVLTVSAVPGEVAIALGAATAKSGRRSEAVGVYLGAAKQFKGTRCGVDALMEAAGCYAAHCMVAPLGNDGWDNAIKLYRRVISEYPNTKQARNARWCVATCTGCWARYGCCHRNQGKQDWPKAIELYRELYESAKDRGSQCDALRRTAEIECNRLGRWQEGLALYRQILAEFPAAVAKSPYWTNRTCGPHDGTWLIDRDLLDFTFPKLLRNTWTVEEATELRDEFLRLAPQMRTIHFHTLWALGNRLRHLGSETKADEIEARLGRCKTWLVIGPFDNNQGAMSRTAYGSEEDFLAGQVDVNKVYEASLDTGQKAKSMWLNRPSITFIDNWKSSWLGGENSGLYALTYVTSPQARAAHLRIGSSGPIKAWLNREVVLDTPGDDFSVMDQFVAAIKLRKGRNELFLKLAVATGFCRNHCRIADRAGVALQDIEYSVPTVPAANEERSDFLRPQRPKAQRQAQATLRRGFRHDPMKWIEHEQTLQGALVRKLVVGTPQPGDVAIIQEEVDKILSGQAPDGSLADPENRGAIKATGNGLLKLLEMGCSPDEPRIKRAVAAIERAIGELPRDKWEETRGGALPALARLGRTDKPALRSAAKRAARDALQHPGCGCPWADQIHFMRIWAGRHATDIGGQIDKMAAWMEDAAQPPGCSAKIGLCHTWSLVKSIAVVDHPACRRIARNLVPMILRAQRPDGSWGDDEHSTFWVLTLLKKHGLFEQLRQLPPLPPDWRVVRSIPAPGKKPRALAWDGKRLWVHDGDKESPAAIAVSTADGTVLKTVKLPKLKQCSPIGIWDGDLTLTTHGRNRALFRIDAETGEVVRRVSLRFLGDFLSTATQLGDKLIIGDHWDSGVSVLDAADPTKRIRHVRTPSGTPQTIAVAGDEFWLADIWAPSVVRTNLQGKRLEWAEKPFGSVGIAWDGTQLWALDPKKKRLCVIERTTKETAP